jgi:hypothetical protein
MTTDRTRYVQAFTADPNPPRRRSRLAIYTAAVATATLVVVVAFGLLWLYGGDPR